MNQNFSSDQTIKLLRRYELTKARITKDELTVKLNEAFEKICNNSFEFNIFKSAKHLVITDLAEKLILRKLNDNIKRLYKDKQGNRRMIVSQVRTLLGEESSMWIYRSDISSFYESIQTNKLFDKLQSDSMLSYYSMKLLKCLFDHTYLQSQRGLPLGISISSTLSELYLRKFDEAMRRIEGTYYYARFVDDIICFCYRKEDLARIDNIVEESLLLESLTKNKSKTRDHDGGMLRKGNPLEFLGYEFYQEQSKGVILLTIARKKIKKIKTKIILAFVDFIKNKDKLLLEDRIKFLSGNYIIKTSEEGSNLKAGIYYNYSLVEDLKCFKELNTFYHKTINCKRSSFGARLSASIDPVFKARLSRYCFAFGFANKVLHNFDNRRMSKITSCWK